MSSSTIYTFDLLNTPFAQDHALHCLSVRPDDFVQFSEVTNNPILFTEQSVKKDDSLRFILAYENGQLMDQVGGVRILDEGSRVFVVFGFSAPVNGSLSYVYGNLFLELLRFLSSKGYSKFSTKYDVNQSANNLFIYFSQAFPQYNFTFKEQGTEVALEIDLVNLNHKETL